MRISVALFVLIALNGCATNFESQPLAASHPASVEAQEALHPGTNRLITTDELTRTTKAQLTRKEVRNPHFQKDMSGMGGMQHDMSKMEGMDHSEMKGMTAPAPAASPANKEALELEMKGTSDQMKKASDELKAEADNAQRTKKTDGNSAPSETFPAAAIYTCVMHPEVQQSTPGKCPKCAMTLVKKEVPPP